MPSAEEILEGLGTIANAWQALAVLWHVYFGLFAAAALRGWRPPIRLVGALLIPPLASVSVLAWMQGNPFNGTLFGVLSVVLVGLLRGMSAKPVMPASPLFLVLGSLLFGFAWTYPHFLEGEPGSAYLFAAPLGLIPCPTLSMVVGIATIFRGLRSPAWSLVLAAAALFYGLFGALHLGVTIDWILAGGGVSLLILAIQQAAGGDARGV